MRIRTGSWDDFDGVYALVATPQSVPDWVRSRWATPSFDPGRHLWLAEDGGGIEAFGAFYAPDEAVVRGNPQHIPALLERIETQARKETVPRLWFVLPEWDKPAIDAYLAYGFEVSTEVLEMERDLGEPIAAPTFPDGIAVRAYAEDDADAVHDLLDQAYLDWDDGYTPMLLDDWRQWMTGFASFDPSCWWIAEANEAPAGVCLTWAEGWVKDIATTSAWRGRGLGKALLVHALTEHAKRGNKRMGLKVDSLNPTAAIPLYERIGFRTIKKYVVLGKQL